MGNLATDFKGLEFRFFHLNVEVLSSILSRVYLNRIKLDYQCRAEHKFVHVILP